MPENTSVASKHILVIDDEKRFFDELLIDLKPLKCNLHHAFDEAQANEILKNNPIDLIILDYYLKGQYGTDLLSKYKNIYPDLPIIFATAFPSSVLHEQPYKEGCGPDEIVSKPNCNGLAAYVKRYLEKKGDDKIKWEELMEAALKEILNQTQNSEVDLKKLTRNQRLTMIILMIGKDQGKWTERKLALKFCLSYTRICDDIAKLKASGWPIIVTKSGLYLVRS